MQTDKHSKPRLTGFLITFIILISPLLRASPQQETAPATTKLRIYLWSTPPQEQPPVPTPPTDGPPPALLPYKTPIIQYIDAAGKLKSIPAPARRLSPVYPYRGPNRFTLIQPNQSAPGAGAHESDTTTYHSIGQVALPPHASEIALLLFPDPNAPQVRYDILPIPISTQEIPSENALAINTSDTELALKVGDRQIHLKPNASQRISLTGTENRMLFIQLASLEQDGQWTRQPSQSIPLPPKNRMLLILHKTSTTAYKARGIGI